MPLVLGSFKKTPIFCNPVLETSQIAEMECLSMVEISFDKVVSHLFIDSMSLVAHGVPPWLVASGEILKIQPVQIAGSCNLKLLQRFILSSVTASNW